MTNKVKGNDLIEEMFSTGAHFGYSKTRRHPSVASYIFATKNKTDIIDLEKTTTLLDEAARFLKALGSKGGILLLVGTKPESREAIRDAALSLDMPFVTERWIGGTLSNFPEIKKRINELEEYRKENLSGGLEKYTKKERLLISKKMEKLSLYYSGLSNLKKIPEALLIIDPKTHKIALAEAQKYKIPVVALLNSDSNIKSIDYPIIGNDASVPSIKFFIKHLVTAYKEGQMSAPSTTPQPKETKDK